MKTTILLLTKTSVTNYREIVENTKQNIMRYVGTRFVESLDPGLPSLTLNCELSDNDKAAISKSILTKDIMHFLFVEGEKILTFNGTVKI